MTGEGNNAPFELRTNCAKGSPLEILRGFGPKPPLYKQYAWNLNGDIPYLAAEAEKLSRTKLVDVLKEAGFTGKANEWNRNAALPDGIEQLLSEMVFTSQFHAVRELHAAIAARGESPALLGGLVRGYANLGLLTEYHWHPAHRSFKARALLYAQRMAARDEKSAWTRWHRAYALALIGLHKFALEDIEAAAKDAKSAAARAPAEPAWVAIIKAYCHYDLDRLAALRAGSPQAQLAGLLAYCSAELAGNTKIAVSKAKELLPSMPECYPFYDGLCANGDLDEIQQGASRRQTCWATKLYPELAAMSGLPESVTEILKQGGGGKGFLENLLAGDEAAPAEEFRTRGRLMAALRAAGTPTADGRAPADRGEPSWSALGNLISETSFLQTWRQVHFCEVRDGNADEFLARAAPLVAVHRYRASLESHASNPAAQKKAREQLAKINEREEGLDLRGICMFQEFYEYDRKRWDAQDPAIWLTMDKVANDLFVWAENMHDCYSEASHQLLEISPDSPYAKAAMVECDWPNVRHKAAAWEKDAGRQPVLLVALAKRHEEDGDCAAAMRCLQAALRRSARGIDLLQVGQHVLEAGRERQVLGDVGKVVANARHGPGPWASPPADRNLSRAGQALVQSPALCRRGGENRHRLGRLDGGRLPGRNARLGCRRPVFAVGYRELPHFAGRLVLLLPEDRPRRPGFRAAGRPRRLRQIRPPLRRPVRRLYLLARRKCLLFAGAEVRQGETTS